MKYWVYQYIIPIQYMTFLYTKSSVHTKFGYITYLLSSHAPKPNLLILQLILVSIIGSYNTSPIRFITLSPSLLSSSLKISYISKLLIRGVVPFYLIQCLLLMPPIRSTASGHHNKLILLILSISKVMLSCFYYIKKGLLYVVIASPFSCQLLSYAKYIKVNIHFSCNIYLVFNAKYKRLINCLNYYMLCLIYFRVLDLIYY